MNCNDFINEIPARVSVTSDCNLNCFFCHNEGMSQRGTPSHMDASLYENLTKILRGCGIEKIAITGGEPFKHPDIFSILEMTKSCGYRDIFLHTNGTMLTDDVLSELDGKITKLGVSVHTLDQTVRGFLSGNNSDISFLQTIANHAGRTSYIVEMKYVPILGVNDSEESLVSFLEFCNESKFKFKFLNYEIFDMERSHYDKLHIDNLVGKLLASGCKKVQRTDKFRGQCDYLPITELSYKESSGVAIETYCGEEYACAPCYKTTEMFVTPELKIKPCRRNVKQFDISKYVCNMDARSVMRTIVDSRAFLKSLYEPK